MIKVTVIYLDPHLRPEDFVVDAHELVGPYLQLKIYGPEGTAAASGDVVPMRNVKRVHYQEVA